MAKKKKPDNDPPKKEKGAARNDGKPAKTPRGGQKKDETVEEIYARYKREFSAADLQEYTQIDWDKTIPLRNVIAELEALQKQEPRKRKKA